MKNLILICLCMLCFSCQTQKRFATPYLAVYQRDRAGNVAPAYIILRTQPKVFEIYAPGIYSGTFGEWNIKKDTLFVFPKWEYDPNDNKIVLFEIKPEYQTVTSIPQQFLMKNNSLFDITDYSTVIPEYLYNDNNYIPEYKRIK